jgi:hypothetical protein
MAAPGALPRIIQLQDGSYATPDGRGGWAPYTGALPGGATAGAKDDSFKVGDGDAIGHAWNIVDSINATRSLATKPLATGTAAATITGIPIIGGLVGQNRANLQTKLGQITGDLRQLGIRTLYQQTGQKGVGSVARNQAEQQALQNSLAAIGASDQAGHPSGQQPDAATLSQGLDQAQTIYLRHLARLHGMNPDDPNTINLLTNASKDPKLRATLMQQTQQVAAHGSADQGVTTVAPPVLKDEGLGSASTSGTTQVVEDPHLKAVGAHIAQMLNSGASDDQIRAYAKANNAGRPNVEEELTFRRNNPGAAGKFTVSPEFYRTHVPLTGVKKAVASLDTIPYAGPATVGAADTALMGAAPDIAGVIHGVTGAGPTREEVIKARDISAAENPGSTFAGNALGAVLSPIGRGGGIGRTALTGAGYGFFGSEDPSLGSRLTNAALSGTIGAAAHGATGFALNSARPVYRAGRNAVLSPFVDREALATENALSRAANSMPRQDLNAATAQFADLGAKGAQPPAAAVLSRAGQDYLSTLASGSPAAKTAATEIAGANRSALPQALADDFNNAIRDATPANGLEKDMLNKPVREIASDVQNMASREYEVGMRPIANEPLKVTPDLTEVLSHERIGGAIRDALSSHQLDEATRTQLRGLPGQLKALGTSIPGGNPAMQAAVRAKYAEGIPLTIAGARNIATALDRTAAKLQEGSEGGVELRRLSGAIRQAIGEQYPEFAPINERYAGRMRAIDILDHTRSNFLGDSPEQIDALAKTAQNYSDAPNAPEYRGNGAGEPNGEVLPSNRQFGIAGAREAASTKAGAGTGEGGTRVAAELASGPNQQARNAMVLGDAGAAKLAQRAGAKAQVSDVLQRIASGPSGDQTAKWYSLAKRALMYKVTGGTAHYAAAYALSGIPGMSANDAARVVKVYMNSGSADQAFNSLTKAYGAQRARTIMARMVGVASGATYQHNTPIGSPVGAQ